MFAFVLNFVLWAALHSLTAVTATKERATAVLGQRAYEGLYRLLYNLFAVVTFLPVLYSYLILPDAPLWAVPTPWRWGMWGLQGLGALGLLYALWQTDFLAFAGLKQAYLFVSGEPVNKEATQTLGEVLVVGGLYRYMRHPLYTFSMLFLWANPVMTRNSLVLAVVFSLYFVVGSVWEERRLKRQFGALYGDYQRRVPRFVPRPWRSS
ncbi:MAG: DUF1295 domain-containing protein [Anaerolineales bacterium]|nr:DUF1295 domain-containing protein [Anaerolineales bacterium]